MSSILDIIGTSEFWYSVIRVTTPILFAALGALISDSAGVINIALEGSMLWSAFAGVVFSAWFDSAWIGLLAAIIIGALVGLMLAYFALNLKTDIILSAIALNLMAAGGTVFLLFVVSGDRGISSSLDSRVLPKLFTGLADKVPFIGPVIFGHNVLTYVAFVLVFATWFFMFKTPMGLRLRAVGENFHAAESVGISVKKIQYQALVLSGIMAGLGGAFMSMGYVSWFSQNMTAGRGFIALAAKAMGGVSPIGTMIASLFFGFASALANYEAEISVPAEFVKMIPYIFTIVGLVVYASKKQADVKRARQKQAEAATSSKGGK